MANANELQSGRFCPLCDRRMDSTMCAVHGVPTINPVVFQESDARLRLGDLVGDAYKLENVLGKGGTSAVFQAVRVLDGTRVALKILKRAYVTDPVHIKRFYREALAVAQLEHPSVVRTYDFGIDERTHSPYIAMELLRGKSLDDLVRDEGPLPERRLAALLAQVSAGLVHAHGLGLVHRDLKPQNIFVVTGADGREQAKILDFGIAKIVRSESEEGEDLTKIGTRVGTPSYMSPEQIKGRALDGRSDLYSLGCILHLVATGRPPFEAADGLAMFLCHLNEHPPALSDRMIDGQPPTEGLRALHDALLAKIPQLRPATADVVERALHALSRGLRPSELLDSLDRTAIVPQAFPMGPAPRLALSPEVREAQTVTVGPAQVAALEKAMAGREAPGGGALGGQAGVSAQAAPAAAQTSAAAKKKAGGTWMYAAAGVLLLVGAGVLLWLRPWEERAVSLPTTAARIAAQEVPAAVSPSAAAPSGPSKASLAAPRRAVAPRPAAAERVAVADASAPATAAGGSAPAAGAAELRQPPAAAAAPAPPAPSPPSAVPGAGPAAVGGVASALPTGGPPGSATGEPTRPTEAAVVASAGAALPAKPAEEPQARPAVAAVRLESLPSGAKVVLGGRVIGNTPMELRPAPEPTELVIRANGYRDEIVVVDLKSPASISVDLEKRQRKAGPAAGGTGTAGGTSTAIPVW